LQNAKLLEGYKTQKLFSYRDLSTEFNLKQSPAFTKAHSRIYFATEKKGGVSGRGHTHTIIQHEYGIFTNPFLIQFIAHTLHLKQKESDTTPTLPLAAVTCLSYRRLKIYRSDQGTP